MTERKASIVLGARDATGPAFASAQRRFEQLQSGAIGVAARVTGITAAVAGAVATLDRLNPGPILAAADELAKLSQRTGVAVEKLSAYQYAGSLADVSTQDLADSLKKLNINIAAAAAGEQKQAESFRAIGVAVVDTAGKVRSADEVFEDIADRFASYEDGANKVAIANAVGGRSFEQLIPLLNGGRAGFKAAREEAEQFGIIIGAELAAKSERFNDNLTKIQAAADGVKVAIAGGVIDALVAYSEEALTAAKNSDLLAFSVRKLRDLFTGKLLSDAFFGSKELSQLQAAESEVATLDARMAQLQAKLNADPKNAGLANQLRLVQDTAKQARGDLDALRAAANRTFRAGDKAGSDFSGAPPPKRQAPALPNAGAASDARAVLAKQLDARLQALRSGLENERDLFQFADARLSEQFRSGEVSIRGYYDAKQRAQDEFLRKQIAGFNALIAEQQAFEARATKPAEREEARNRVAELSAERERAIREAGQAAEVAGTQRKRDLVDFERSLQDLDAQLADLSGDRYGAELLRNAQRFADARALLARGDADPARLNVLGKGLSAQTEFARLQENAFRLSEQARNAEEKFLIVAERSGLSRSQVEEGVKTQRESALASMDQLIARTEQLADATTKPDVIRYLEELRLARERAFDAKDPGLQRFNDLADEMGANVADAWERAALSGEKLSDIGKNLGKQLGQAVFNDLVTQPLRKSITESIKAIGKGGEGGGADRLFSGLINKIQTDMGGATEALSRNVDRAADAVGVLPTALQQFVGYLGRLLTSATGGGGSSGLGVFSAIMSLLGAGSGTGVGITNNTTGSLVSNGLGAGRAAGGPVFPHTMHPVLERGDPELLSTSRGDFLMMGGERGYVTALKGATRASDGRRGGGEAPKITIINQAGVPLHASSASKISEDEYAMVVTAATERAVAQINAQTNDPNSPFSRRMAANFGTQRARR